MEVSIRWGWRPFVYVALKQLSISGNPNRRRPVPSNKEPQEESVLSWSQQETLQLPTCVWSPVLTCIRGELMTEDRPICSFYNNVTLTSPRASPGSWMPVRKLSNHVHRFPRCHQLSLFCFLLQALCWAVSTRGVSQVRLVMGTNNVCQWRRKFSHCYLLSVILNSDPVFIYFGVWMINRYKSHKKQLNNSRSSLEYPAFCTKPVWKYPDFTSKISSFHTTN